MKGDAKGVSFFWDFLKGFSAVAVDGIRMWMRSSTDGVTEPEWVARLLTGGGVIGRVWVVLLMFVGVVRAIGVLPVGFGNVRTMNVFVGHDDGAPKGWGLGYTYDAREDGLEQ